MGWVKWPECTGLSVFWKPFPVLHLHQNRVQQVFVGPRQPVLLQPQDHVGFPVGPQGQQVADPLPQGPVLHAPPGGRQDALLLPGHASFPDAAEDGHVGRGFGLGKAGQSRGRRSHRYSLACEKNQNDNQKYFISLYPPAVTKHTV